MIIDPAEIEYYSTRGNMKRVFTAEDGTPAALLLEENIYNKAKSFREERTFEANTWEEFQEKVEKGFVYAHWDGSAETEEKIKEATKATIRCIPVGNELESGKCIFTGNPSTQKVLFAKAY